MEKENDRNGAPFGVRELTEARASVRSYEDVLFSRQKNQKTDVTK